MKTFIITSDKIYEPITGVIHKIFHCSDCFDLTFDGKKKYRTNFTTVDELKQYVYASDYYRDGGAVKFTMCE